MPVFFSEIKKDWTILKAYILGFATRGKKGDLGTLPWLLVSDLCDHG